jgi:hypothetical protein
MVLIMGLNNVILFVITYFKVVSDFGSIIFINGIEIHL